MWTAEQEVTRGRLQRTGASLISGNNYFFSERVVNRWNKFSQNDVDQTTINGFKKALERSRDGLLHGLMSAKSLWLHLPGKLPGKLHSDDTEPENI